jgi:hypothetical protein
MLGCRTSDYGVAPQRTPNADWARRRASEFMDRWVKGAWTADSTRSVRASLPRHSLDCERLAVFQLAQRSTLAPDRPKRGEVSTAYRAELARPSARRLEESQHVGVAARIRARRLACTQSLPSAFAVVAVASALAALLIYVWFGALGQRTRLLVVPYQNSSRFLERAD